MACLFWELISVSLGISRQDGTVVFDFSLQVKLGSTGSPVFTGSFAHGSPSERFLYLGWRDVRGAFAQRLKLPLAGITWEDVQASIDRQKRLVGTLVDHHPRVTSTGANIGGSRPIEWLLL